jgi:hypothetical protein
MDTGHFLTLKIDPMTPEHLTETDEIASSFAKGVRQILIIIGNSFGNQLSIDIHKKTNDRSYVYVYELRYTSLEGDVDFCLYLIDFIFEVLSSLVEGSSDREIVLSSLFTEMQCQSENFYSQFDRAGFCVAFRATIPEFEKSFRSRKKFKFILLRSWKPMDICAVFGFSRDDVREKGGEPPKQLPLGWSGGGGGLTSKTQDPDSREPVEGNDDCPIIELTNVNIVVRYQKGQYVLVFLVNGSRNSLTFEASANLKLLDHINVHGLGDVTLEVDLAKVDLGVYHVVDVCTDCRA